MLISIRKKISGWLAWVVVIIISVPFVLFGINAYFEGVSQVNVANVGGEKISLQSFQQAAEQRRQYFRSQFGASFDTSMLDTPEARRSIVEELVVNQAEREYLKSNGLTLNDDALQRRIVQTPSFQEDGKFNQDTYRRILSASGYTTEGYEQQERTAGAGGQLRDGVVATSFANDAEVNHLLSLNMQQRDVDYLVIDAKPLEADIEISDADINQEYEANPDAYQQVERVKLDYLELNVIDLQENVELTEEEIAQAYESSKGRYTQPEVRKASHILLSVPRSASDEKKAEVLEAAQSVFDQAMAGADFAELAEMHSEDPGSAKKGGDLGIVAKDQMVEPFEEAVFSMSKDEIRGPVETEFGYHIIKLTDLTEERQQALEEVVDVVRQAEKKRVANSQFAEVAETFRTLVFEQPDDLVEASEALGITIKTSDWVTASNGAAPFNNANLRATAFDSTVIDEDLNSEAVEVSDGVLVAVHKNDYEEAHLKELSEVKQQIIDQLTTNRASEAAQTKGEAVMASLKQGSDFSEELVEMVKVLPATKEAITDPVEREISTLAYSSSAPEDGGVLVDGLELNNGNYAVFRLKDVTLGDPATATEQQRNQVVQQLSQRDGNGAYILFRNVLRSSTDVEIFDSAFAGDLTNNRYPN